MARKTNLCVCLSSEEIESLEQKAKDLGLSKSATIGRLLIQPLSNNIPQNHPENCGAKLDKFLKILDKLILEDHQTIFDIVVGDQKTRPEAKTEEKEEE